MSALRDLRLSDSIQINTTPEKVWSFFENLEKNYKDWHPEDHTEFKWTKGEPLKVGSKFYAEQYGLGRIKRYRGICEEVIPNKKIVLKFSFPVSIISPRIEWKLDHVNNHTVFRSTTFLRVRYVWCKLFRRSMKAVIAEHNKHTMKESENLKKILEV